MKERGQEARQSQRGAVFALLLLFVRDSKRPPRPFVNRLVNSVVSGPQAIFLSRSDTKSGRSLYLKLASKQDLPPKVAVSS